MIVFKLYWKIFRKNLMLVLIYFIVFLLIIFLALGSSQDQSFNYQDIKTDIAFVDLDDSQISRTLHEYLKRYALFKDIKKDRIEDALFYNDIKMYIEIPEGFGESLKGEDPLIIKTKSIPSDPAVYIIKGVINKFANFASIYLRNDLETENLSLALQETLDQEVELLSLDLQTQDYSSSNYYYNYMAYVIIALVIEVISSIMVSFKPLEIKRRNLIASFSNRKLNLILLLANLLLGLIFLGLLILLSIFLYPKEVLSITGLLMGLNALIFTISMIALAYLIVSIFDSKTVVGAFGTIFSLGFAFISGVFIPQKFLDKAILTLARVFPSFYYVENNNNLIEINNFNYNSLKGVYLNYLIQFLFTALFVAISIIVIKRRQTKES